MGMKTIIVLALITVSIVSFQNCSQVAFDNPEDFTNLSSFTDTTFVETKMNTPITFNVEHSKPIVVDSIKVEVEGTSINGNFEILDEKNIQFKYTPNFGFRGRDSVRVTVKDKYQNSAILYVIANVGNALSDFEPALAVRGMGCIQCHANIKSNIVTDFGYGNDYYFGTKPANSWWRSGGVYGDHDNKFGTMSIPADKTVHVPKANLPVFVASATGKQTVAQYVQGLFAASEFTNTRSVAVAEQNSIYIGAPTEEQITTSLRLGATERSRYYKNAADSIELSGLVDQGTFFELSGRMDCDGDRKSVV